MFLSFLHDLSPPRHLNLLHVNIKDWVCLFPPRKCFSHRLISWQWQRSGDPHFLSRRCMQIHTCTCVTTFSLVCSWSLFQQMRCMSRITALRFDRWKHASFLCLATPAGLYWTPTMQRGGEWGGGWWVHPALLKPLLTENKPSRLIKGDWYCAGDTALQDAIRRSVKLFTVERKKNWHKQQKLQQIRSQCVFIYC